MHSGNTNPATYPTGTGTHAVSVFSIWVAMSEKKLSSMVIFREKLYMKAEQARQQVDGAWLGLREQEAQVANRVRDKE